MRKSVLAVGTVLLAAMTATAAPPPWIEIRSRHFTVITNSSERAGRRAAWQFEQIRQALLVIWPWAAIDGGRPIEIFAVRDEPTLKSLGPQFWEGKRFRPTSFWVGGADRQYIALRTDVAEPDDVGENPYQTAYWNYASLVFHRSLPVGVPAWYSRGVADVLSNTIVREKEIHVGRLISDRLRSVREMTLISLPEFLAADRTSRYLTGDLYSWQFDSQAWAFVHYLMFGNRGEHSGRVNRYNQLLLQGTASDVALKEAFGPDMTPYFAGMRDYIRKAIFQYARIPVALDLKPEGFSSRPLPSVESLLRRASLLVAMDRPAEARALATEASKVDPANPGAVEVEGQLLDREGKTTEALAAFAKAVDLGSKRAQVYYRMAQLSRPRGGADDAANAKLAAILEKAIELDPDFANALSFLADIKIDLGRADDSITLAQRAMKLEPDASYHRITLARALWNTRRPEEAVVVARSAMAVAATDEERGYVQRFLDFAARTSRPPLRPTSSPATTLSPLTASKESAAVRPLRVDTSGTAAVSVCIEQRDNLACGKAAPLLQESCDQGEGYACRALGSLHDGGFGVPMNKKAAAAAYDAGCRMGSDKPSCARYAVLQMQGLGVQRDSVAALATLERLCGENVEDACIGWALILAGRTEKRDLPKARALLQAPCNNGNEEACRLLKSMSAK